MNILVTGACGFIGFHVAKELVALGHGVTGIDSMNDYYDVELKKYRKAKLGCCVWPCNINDEVTHAIFRENRFDVVVHLAAQAGVRHSLTRPFDYTKANVTGFLSVLEGCRHSGVKRLVYASSSSVYGGNTYMPFSEDNTVNKPLSLYAATKRANELMSHSYTHLYGLDTVGLRFFTVYGPMGRPDMAMWKFAEAIDAGKPIDLYNYGKMKRDFTYIDDIVQGVVACTDLEQNVPPILNLGNNRSEELMKVVGLISQEIGKEAEINPMPMQPGDVPETYADIQAAETYLKYYPKTTIDVGVPKFIKWWKEYKIWRKTCFSRPRDAE